MHDFCYNKGCGQSDVTDGRRWFYFSKKEKSSATSLFYFIMDVFWNWVLRSDNFVFFFSKSFKFSSPPFIQGREGYAGGGGE